MGARTENVVTTVASLIIINVAVPGTMERTVPFSPSTPDTIGKKGPSTTRDVVEKEIS